MNSQALSFAFVLSLWAAGNVFSQSADWQNVIWIEPQVRYLMAAPPRGSVSRSTSEHQEPTSFSECAATYEVAAGRRPAVRSPKLSSNL